MTDAEHWFVYVLRCRGDRLYCGIAKDVEARFAEHRAGKGAKFTRAFPPEAIVATITAAGKAEALREERAFKALARVRKLEQVAEWSERRSNRDPTHATTDARIGT